MNGYNSFGSFILSETMRLATWFDFGMLRVKFHDCGTFLTLKIKTTRREI